MAKTINYPQEVSIVEDAVDIETLHDIWIEIEPNMTCEGSVKSPPPWSKEIVPLPNCPPLPCIC